MRRLISSIRSPSARRTLVICALLGALCAWLSAWLIALTCDAARSSDWDAGSMTWQAAPSDSPYVVRSVIEWRSRFTDKSLWTMRRHVSSAEYAAARGSLESATMVDATWTANAAAHEIALWSTAHADGPTPPLYTLEQRVGWPLRSFRVRFDAARVGDFSTATYTPAIIVHRSHLPDFRAESMRALPLTILPVGFVVNALLFGVIIRLAVAFVFVPRRTLRRRAHRCRACGHRLAPAEDDATPPRTPRRPWRCAAVAVAGGLALTIGTSWGCALWAPRPVVSVEWTTWPGAEPEPFFPVTGGALIQHQAGRGSERLVWYRRAQDPAGLGSPAALVVHGTPAPIIIDVGDWLRPLGAPPLLRNPNGPCVAPHWSWSDLPHHAADASCAMVIEHAAGWPLPAFTSRTTAPSAARQADGSTFGGIVVRAVNGMDRETREFVVLPFRPLWPGVIINLALWTILTAAGLTAWRAARRAAGTWWTSYASSRRATIAPHTTCPECGTRAVT